MSAAGRLPDFVIVGAAKSGTSTLARHLRQHPDVYMPGREVHFFDDLGAGQWSERSVDWYRAQFADAGADEVVGEKTPAYSYLPDVPRRMGEVVPDAGLVWMFRDPVDRAYSNYWMAVRNGIEPLDFREAVRRAEEIGADNIWRDYLRRSRYAEQVERFLDHFERESMLFLLFEEFVEEPAWVLDRVFRFLGVPPREGEPPERAANRTFLPRSRRLTRRLRSIFDPGSSGDRLMLYLDRAINRRSEPGYPAMPSDVRTALRERFEEHDRRLERLTGLDVSRWRR